VLFHLFRYRFETPKQTDIFWVSRNKSKTQPKQILFRFVSVRNEFFLFISRTLYLKGVVPPGHRRRSRTAHQPVVTRRGHLQQQHQVFHRINNMDKTVDCITVIPNCRLLTIREKIQEARQETVFFKQRDFLLYSTLLHLPPLTFHCVGGCWDRPPGLLRVRNRQSDALTTRVHPQSARSHPQSAKFPLQ
jgi:hypothetical protein